jgi:hypothetical protein
MKQEKHIILYTTDNGNVTVSVRFENETFWMTQKAVSELFATERSVITKHIANIYDEGELDQESTCAKIAQVQAEGLRQVTRMARLPAAQQLPQDDPMQLPFLG